MSTSANASHRVNLPSQYNGCFDTDMFLGGRKFVFLGYPKEGDAFLAGVAFCEIVRSAFLLKIFSSSRRLQRYQVPLFVRNRNTVVLCLGFAHGQLIERVERKSLRFVSLTLKIPCPPHDNRPVVNICGVRLGRCGFVEGLLNGEDES